MNRSISNKNYDAPFQASVVSNTSNLIVTPGSITVLPETHTYTFTLLAINGFLGGVVKMSIMVSIIKDRVINCATAFALNVPACNPAQARPETQELQIYKT